MRRFLWVLALAVLALAQSPVRTGDVRITADSQSAVGALRHLAGHVVIETATMALTADAADFNPDSREIAVHGGDVHIKLK